MALLRAVVVTQPPGFGGKPSTGHFRSAMAKASWTASSAVSTSLKMRIRVATDRPDSSRKIRAIKASSTIGKSSTTLGSDEGPDLDRRRDRPRDL